MASSSDRAAPDEIQYGFGDGPCLITARERRLVHVPDLRLETRWPEYKDAATANGIISILGVPFELDDGARAALDVYSDRPDKYNDTAIGEIQREVLVASKALRLRENIRRQGPDSTAQRPRIPTGPFLSKAGASRRHLPSTAGKAKVHSV